MLKTTSEAYSELFGLINIQANYVESCIGQCTGCMCSCRCSCSGKNYEDDILWENL
ncbi:FibroRumin family radical SAM-modified Cys-rich RiPP [Campylobacter sp. RM16187]|uniref:FibroRumin family radical SAM-modified Cys-rich RiPP n=1 Tax=Campylobacter sp. RM16187 TaxID=1660063 RepID=UPI0021B68718|nr:FibroRumin family radical SAM-modified Cys-rich RiPP [Campylobacter sp. RM16187]QKG30325.1 putative cysteine-rich protein [Campylobacter sp. RM16187]